MQLRKAPCKTCPFRLEPPAFRNLRESRARQIADTLLQGESFVCHGDIDKRDKSHCVGAMLILRKLGQPNQLMQVAQRLIGFDADTLKGGDEVFDNFETWIACQGE